MFVTRVACVFAGVVWLGGGLLAGQAPTAKSGSAAVFEAADVHASPPRLRAFMRVRGGMEHGEFYRLRDASMVDLIAYSYGVDPSDIFGGPTWLEFDRYEIIAKTPAGTTQETVKPMVRALLGDRFGLVAHADTRPLAAFVLSAEKGTKMKPTQASAEEGGCEYQEPPKDAPTGTAMNIRFSCKNVTMQSFAEFLHDVAEPYLTRPVVDATGLKGGWDFDIGWTYRVPKEGGGVTIFAAVEKQLGLKLEAKTAPLPVVVVDHVNEKPTPNVAGLEKILPPAPAAAFEVATIRPSNPEEKHFNIDTDMSGKVEIRNASLQRLIIFAWDLGAGKIEGKPKWLDDDHYDIAGKAAMEPAAGLQIPGAGHEVDVDEVKEMVRSLLADRFKMKSHMEDRPADVFALVTANPKMKKADPANHPSCKEGPGADGKDPRIDTPVLSRLISCQNMTMAQLTVELHILVPGYLPAPVIDATGLDGAYDFSLSFSKSSDLRGAGGAAGGDDSGASDPGGGMTLFTAMQRQLGLKLEKREKVPVAELVIDHIEQKPTEN